MGVRRIEPRDEADSGTGLRLQLASLHGYVLEAPFASTIVTSAVAMALAGVIGTAESATIPASYLLAAGLVNARLLFLRLGLPVELRLLDAVAVALLIGMSGHGGSPFYPLALAGIWWAAQPRNPRGALLYTAGFAITYAGAVLPRAALVGELAAATWELLALVCAAVLLTWLVTIDSRVLALTDRLSAHGVDGNELSLRRGLAAALGTPDAPVDALLAAAQVGLTADQTRLLGYLILGLTTQEIARALVLSEAAVRYRLTRLYRILEVRGRREAVLRAHAMGLPVVIAVGPVDRRRLDRVRGA